MFEPSSMVFYVDNIATSSRFYQELLGISPQELSPTFRIFQLSNGMGIGLKDKHAQQPSIDGHGACELAFTVTTHDSVDKLYLEWQQKGVSIKELPTMVSFGYTFIATDPDGNRLRVVALGE